MLRNGKDAHTATHEIITDLAPTGSRTSGTRQAVMLMCQHKAPHRNWQPGPDYLDMYEDATIPEPDTLFDDYATRGTPAKTQDMSIAKTMNDSDLKLSAPRGLTPEQKAKWDAAYEPKNKAFREANLQGKDLVRWKYQRYLKDYCVHHPVDDKRGRLLKYVDEAGLAERPVVIFSSDQGFYLGEQAGSTSVGV